MRGAPDNQSSMFSYVSLEDRIPKSHPNFFRDDRVEPVLKSPCEFALSSRKNPINQSFPISHPS